MELGWCQTRAGAQCTLPLAGSGCPAFCVRYSSGPWGSEGAGGFTLFICCILGTSGPTGDHLEYLVLQHFGDINHFLKALSSFTSYISTELGVKSN